MDFGQNPFGCCWWYNFENKRVEMMSRFILALCFFFFLDVTKHSRKLQINFIVQVRRATSTSIYILILSTCELFWQRQKIALCIFPFIVHHLVPLKILSSLHFSCLVRLVFKKNKRNYTLLKNCIWSAF